MALTHSWRVCCPPDSPGYTSGRCQMSKTENSECSLCRLSRSTSFPRSNSRLACYSGIPPTTLRPFGLPLNDPSRDREQRVQTTAGLDLPRLVLESGHSRLAERRPMGIVPSTDRISMAQTRPRRAAPPGVSGVSPTRSGYQICSGTSNTELLRSVGIGLLKPDPAFSTDCVHLVFRKA